MQNEKHIYVALILSSVFMLLNIVAVTTGMAEPIYSPITQWLFSLH